ncbi:zinc-binding alcohol dehydrogenase family protein [Xylophilus sp. GOD-11R]|uniref:zinc-binding alcohol dehydrogenase family protein n=1 Tax=Xylophilus sp. GOD-11R TaxID=3089814 RepID=UPI00298C979E|nr:zinc-binding alcohol dehydrogenase family protein [Xylophilus sp. GOD-11R]WPB57036.1 zinc-binding alcohol dehydrogenase family protein [Xylophilus sp. GOD-11R]
MKAIGFAQPLPIDQPGALQDIELPAPQPGPRDLLVRVQAVSVNPVDTKVRRNAKPAPGQFRVLGWDAVGTVEATGAQVRNFQPGDRVYYAGSILRPGTNSELHAVDERIVALAPKSLSDTQAAALPLTSITAYELLFDRLGVAHGGGAGQTLLVVGGAGGVGSILIQLARQLTQLRIVATASRAETRQWCLDLGAHLVVDHRFPLAAALREEGIASVDMVASLTQTEQHYEQLIEALMPQGKLAVIDDMPVLNAMPLKSKCISLHWEIMFARSSYETPDMHRQGELLAEVAQLVDAGRVRTTLGEQFGRIDAANLTRAHAFIESGKAQGKVVLEGF